MTDPTGTASDLSGTIPAPQVWPTLYARDALVLIAFLVDAFGFERTVVYADGDVVHHAELAWPLGGGIMLGSARAGETDPALSAGGFCAYVVVRDPDALFARATANGASVIRGLNETDYGSREFAVTDPEGNRWSFGTFRGEPRK
jgi:uncharacterized glyoxalase superfamily protein PhnB